MKRSTILASMASVLLIGLGATAPANAGITTFASFVPFGQQKNFTWTNDNVGGVNEGTGGTATATPNGTREVKFSFLNAFSNYISNLPAYFTFTASAPDGSPTEADPPGPDAEDGITNISGSFSFTTVNQLTIGHTQYAPGTNLLSGVFTAGTDGALLYGNQGGSSASLTDDNTQGDTVTFTSAFLSFAPTVARDIDIALNTLSPALNGDQGGPDSFVASASGNFSSDPAPSYIIAVPEPASWALMLIGLGGVGYIMRRRHVRAAAI